MSKLTGTVHIHLMAHENPVLFMAISVNKYIAEAVRMAQSKKGRVAKMYNSLQNALSPVIVCTLTIT